MFNIGDKVSFTIKGNIMYSLGVIVKDNNDNVGYKVYCLDDDKVYNIKTKGLQLINN